MKYRKKPVVIDAIQYDGLNRHQLWVFYNSLVKPESPKTVLRFEDGDGEPYIDTLEGEQHISVNDWLICGTRGEFYPCKPAMFADSYDIYQPKQLEGAKPFS